MTKEEIEALDDSFDVCLCMNITLGEIRDAIKDGSDTIEKLIETTEAGSICELCQSLSIDEDEDREIHLDEILSSMKS